MKVVGTTCSAAARAFRAGVRERYQPILKTTATHPPRGSRSPPVPRRDRRH
jgi:hypothetical protein